MKSNSFEDLIVWQKAHKLVLEIYKFCADIPKLEKYGLVPQMRRAAVSIPANIAEGYKKLGKKDKIRFFNIAQGSLEECRYYMILSKDLGYGENKEIEELFIEVGKLINSYIRGINENEKT